MIEVYESRFKEIAKISEDLTVYPIPKHTQNTQTKTNKLKSDTFGEVFTPLWLVDEMIDRISDRDMKDTTKTTLDLCSGYGQFSIRLIRKKYLLLGESFDITQFLTNTHYFSELQLDSCYNLLYIFGKDINLFIGESQEIPKLESDSKGIWHFYGGSWINISDEIKSFYDSCSLESFVNKFSTLHYKPLDFMEW